MATLLQTWSTNLLRDSSESINAKGQIKVYLESQSIVDNSSYIKIDHYAVVYGGGEYFDYFTSSYRTNYGSYQSQTSNSPSSGAGTKYIGTTYHTVYHDSYGACSLYVNGTFTGRWYYSIGGALIEGTNTKTSSFTVPLPTIPRTSSVTATDSNIESSTSININRASSSFTHTLRYAFGSLSGTIAENVATNYGWTIPTSFYAQIPNSLSGTCTIYCDTYSSGTLIGTSSCTFTASVNQTTNKPDVSATIIDSNTLTTALTNDNTKFVKYISNAQFSISTSAKNSATISSQSITCADGKSSTSASGTLNAVESGSFTVTATDSRGISNSITYTKTLIDYARLTSNVNLYRTSPTNNTIAITLNGNYFNGTFGSQTNTLTVQYRFKEHSLLTWSGYSTLNPTITDNTFSLEETALGTNFDYTKFYDFEIITTDKIYTGSSQILTQATVKKGIPTYWWNGTSFTVEGDLIAKEVNTGWQSLPANLTYSSPTVLNSDVDLRSVLTKYNKIKLTQEQPLTAYWNLDSNANSQVGTFNGTETNITHSTGKFGNCAVFNGTSSKIVVPDNASLKPTGAFTLGLWFKTSNTGVEKMLFQSYSHSVSGDNKTAGIFLRISTANVLQFISAKNTGYNNDVDQTSVTGSTVVTDNNLHYVVITFYNNYCQMYLDGKLETSNYCFAPVYKTTNYVRIGCKNLEGTDTAFMNGSIDDVFFINGYALDEQTEYAKYISDVAQGTGNILIDKMFVVTDITETTVSIDGGYDFVLTNGTISNPMFSLNDVPYNFIAIKYGFLNKVRENFARYIVHHRQLFGMAGDSVLTLAKGTNTAVFGEFYNLRQYGIDEVPTTPVGYTRYMRFMATWSDNVSAGSYGLQLLLNTSSNVWIRDLFFNTTWGDPNARRDGYNKGDETILGQSGFIKLSNFPNQHVRITATVPSTAQSVGAQTKLYRLEAIYYDIPNNLIG